MNSPSRSCLSSVLCIREEPVYQEKLHNPYVGDIMLPNGDIYNLPRNAVNQDGFNSMLQYYQTSNDAMSTIGTSRKHCGYNGLMSYQKNDMLTGSQPLSMGTPIMYHQNGTILCPQQSPISQIHHNGYRISGMPSPAMIYNPNVLQTPTYDDVASTTNTIRSAQMDGFQLSDRDHRPKEYYLPIRGSNASNADSYIHLPTENIARICSKPTVTPIQQVSVTRLSRTSSYRDNERTNSESVHDNTLKAVGIDRYSNNYEVTKLDEKAPLIGELSSKRDALENNENLFKPINDEADIISDERISDSERVPNPDSKSSKYKKSPKVRREISQNINKRNTPYWVKNIAPDEEGDPISLLNQAGDLLNKADSLISS